jgi:hypothetical protein
MRPERTFDGIYKLRGCLAGQKASALDLLQEERRREREREEKKLKLREKRLRLRSGRR